LTLIGRGLRSARGTRAGSASRRNRLSLDSPRRKGLPITEKFANARDLRQHASGVRYPKGIVPVAEVNALGYN
jgi:hypothetical protein